MEPLPQGAFTVRGRLRFRSRGERRVAEELEQRGITYTPNAVLVLPGCVDKELDLLVFYAGRWGVIEVDGRQVHPSAADDHAWAEPIELAGIRVWRVDGERAKREPATVVDVFLRILVGPDVHPGYLRRAAYSHEPPGGPDGSPGASATPLWTTHR